MRYLCGQGRAVRPEEGGSVGGGVEVAEGASEAGAVEDVLSVAGLGCGCSGESLVGLLFT